MDFVNRIEERKFMSEIISDILNKKETCVWIEGSSGVGKSYFLEYVKKDSNIPVFIYSDYEWMFKCNESTIDNEYQLFIEIISTFQLNHPKEFNKFLVDYFKNIYDISWLETLAYLVPNIKITAWAKDIIKMPLDQIETAKNDVTKMLYNTGLKKCLASMVLYYLTEILKKDNIVICIDDACWLDRYSINTLRLMLNIAKNEYSEKIAISLIALSRPLNELQNEKQNYTVIEDALKEIYEKIKYIKIENFSYEATQEYIKLMDREFVYTATHNIYKVTNGNPKELYQSLKFNDNDLQELIESSDDLQCSNYISVETLMNSSLNPPFEMGDQAKPKRCLEY